jgi:cbb3-type cytochrome oxidase subunit 1
MGNFDVVESTLFVVKIVNTLCNRHHKQTRNIIVKLIVLSQQIYPLHVLVGFVQSIEILFCLRDLG